MPFKPDKWLPALRALLTKYPNISSAWRNADADTIRGAIRGVSPYTGKIKKDGAARVVFNISSADVPSFTRNSRVDAYENRYDHARRIGSAPCIGSPDAREKIDRMLATLFGATAGWDKLYYGAVELNGSGIRYYGDVCLVLDDSKVSPTTKVLNRNSFDLICEPLRSKTHISDVWDPKLAEQQADVVAGQWDEVGDMAACKVLKPGADGDRRLTIGAISEGILADEDYLEVIRESSFNVGDLAEARTSAADAAVDGLVADRLRRGPMPSWSELLWRHRRRRADEALKAKSIPTKVVVSSGRVRT
ncbi:MULTISPECIES: hypothetical protein [unclassified Rhizobium]|uniref:hypothetical protein n=1 Tax=unclassified Rhizobium TaxID=2613769 RepID=UPI001AE4FE1C|nr:MULTISPECIES: hypothetical protein [unclassified Rhizobium]MBP2461174.1 hypothetical protein [Rhizobium sp. PvP014]MBP2528570.1 hypothetical protein [Rhizobium sp. PvP099]